jgi:hypothetical protein
MNLPATGTGPLEVDLLDCLREPPHQHSGINRKSGERLQKQAGVTFEVVP